MTGRLSASKKLIQGLLIGLTGMSLALGLWAPDMLDVWEAKTWDLRVGLLAKPGKATGDILLIKLDQNSLDWAKEESGLSWPWPREVYSAIINYCRRSGARSLAFDVVFTEPSFYGVEDDESFGSAISGFNRFAGAMYLGDTERGAKSRPDSSALQEFNIIGLDNWMKLTGAEGIVFPRATMPVPEVAQNSAVLCNVHLDPDPDGIYRRLKLFGVFDNTVLPSLGLGAYLAANPDEKLTIEPGCLKVGKTSVPIDGQGNTVLCFRGPSGTHKAYSAAAVLQSEFRILEGKEPTTRDKNIFMDKYVLFGFSAPGLHDLNPTPVSGVYPGVEIHATMLDNLLSGDFMRVVPARQTVMLVILLGLFCGVLASFFSSPSGGVAVSVIFLCIPVILSLGFYINGYWLPLVVQETSAIATLAIALVVNYATEGRQKRYINNAFKHYLSPAVIEQLIQHPERLKLGGERRVLSIFFSDLQGFTSISESLSPENLTALLNDYLSAMTEIILEEKGTVDKYEGDAIIAFWNAPLEVPDHAVRVVRAALRCQEKLAEMRPEFRDRIGRDMYMRIGINTGPAVVGNLGSRSRFDYTMLGDAVNLAARLEGANKQFGTYTMISQSTLDMLPEEFSMRELARVAVVGRREPVTVYEPMYREEYEAGKEVLEAFGQGLALFYNGRFDGALKNFAAIRGRDPAAAAYERQCRVLIDSPPGNWQGVWVMTTK